MVKTFEQSIEAAQSMNHVYIIRCEKFMKVGRSYNPTGRLYSLDVGPHPLTLVYVKEFPTRSRASYAELKVHNALKAANQHHRGEWFMYSKKNVGIAVKAMDAIEFLQSDEESKDAIHWMMSKRYNMTDIKNMLYEKGTIVSVSHISRICNDSRIASDSLRAELQALAKELGK